MGSLSIWHWIVVVIVVMLLFGRGKISDLMGDVAQGIKAFKKGMSEEETAQATTPKSDVPPRTLENQPKSRAEADLKHRAETERKVEGDMV
jgi:sec-independent protein translocase protein TatA